jgi:thioredoxin-related protein
MPKIILSLLFFVSAAVNAQDMRKFNLYNPEENAEEKIGAAIREAKANNKHIFIQVGGNWCIWCARFHDFITKDNSIDSLIQANFEVYHLNYSKENYNNALLAKYRYPQRFGFPVFLILDAKGNLLHIQNSEYLEEDKSYNRRKVMEFLSNWTPKALDPSNYK